MDSDDSDDLSMVYSRSADLKLKSADGVLINVFQFKWLHCFKHTDDGPIWDEATFVAASAAVMLHNLVDYPGMEDLAVPSTCRMDVPFLLALKRFDDALEPSEDDPTETEPEAELS